MKRILDYEGQATLSNLNPSDKYVLLRLPRSRGSPGQKLYRYLQKEPGRLHIIVEVAEEGE